LLAPLIPAICLVLSIYSLFLKYDHHTQSGIVAYNVGKLKAVDFICGQRIFSYGDTIPRSKQTFHIDPFRSSIGVSDIHSLPIEQNAITINNKRILMVTSETLKRLDANFPFADLIILTDNIWDEQELIHLFDTSKTSIAYLGRPLKKKIFHEVKEEGAYVELW